MNHIQLQQPPSLLPTTPYKSALPPLESRLEQLRVASPGGSPSCSPKTRKPYTTTRPRENWTAEEHSRFIEGLKLYKRDWKQVEKVVQTKTVVQIRSHAQKYFLKLQKMNSSEKIPPPRPKKVSPKSSPIPNQKFPMHEAPLAPILLPPQQIIQNLSPMSKAQNAASLSGLSTSPAVTAPSVIPPTPMVGTADTQSQGTGKTVNVAPSPQIIPTSSPKVLRNNVPSQSSSNSNSSSISAPKPQPPAAMPLSNNLMRIKMEPGVTTQIIGSSLNQTTSKKPNQPVLLSGGLIHIGPNTPSTRTVGSAKSSPTNRFTIQPVTPSQVTAPSTQVPAQVTTPVPNDHSINAGALDWLSQPTQYPTFETGFGSPIEMPDPVTIKSEISDPFPPSLDSWISELPDSMLLDFSESSDSDASPPASAVEQLNLSTPPSVEDFSPVSVSEQEFLPPSDSFGLALPIEPIMDSDKDVFRPIDEQVDLFQDLASYTQD